jgi:hypothetical protein
MGRATTAFLLFVLFSLACRPMTKSPSTAADQVSHTNSVMELQIHPAAESSPGGARMPLRFTIHNTSDQPVEACLSGGRVIHLWENGRDYGYTLAQKRADQPSCEEPFRLPAGGDYSWMEEVTLPPAPGAARIVGLTQVLPAEPCTGDCGPVWLTGSTPFKIEEKAAGQGSTLDLRTGLMSTDLATPVMAGGPGLVER